MHITKNVNANVKQGFVCVCVSFTQLSLVCLCLILEKLRMSIL